MKKQTAVEFLAWKFATTDIEEFRDKFNEFVKQAKAMEKEQIIQANLEGQFHADGIKADTVAERYYNETFNK